MQKEGLVSSTEAVTAESAGSLQKLIVSLVQQFMAAAGSDMQARFTPTPHMLVLCSVVEDMSAIP